jgi:hypothetical protein
MWLRADGDMRDLSVAISSRNSQFACASGVCLVRAGRAGPVVALASADAIREACRLARIVIVQGHADERCSEGTLVLDQQTLETSGATAIYRRGAALQLSTVSKERGNRPWVPGGP